VDADDDDRGDNGWSPTGCRLRFVAGTCAAPGAQRPLRGRRRCRAICGCG